MNRFLNFFIVTTSISAIVIFVIDVNLTFAGNPTKLQLFLAYGTFILSLALLLFFLILKLISLLTDGASDAYEAYNKLSSEDKAKARGFGKKALRCFGKLTLLIAKYRLRRYESQLKEYEKYRNHPIVGARFKRYKARLERYRMILDFIEDAEKTCKVG